MAAPKGNRFWEARSSHGCNPIFPTPQDLWQAATEYFAWVEENPLYEDKVGFYQGVAAHETCAKMRAMTLDGLTIFLDIGTQTWYDYKAKEGFSEVTSRIERIIRDQKFSGAAADLLNANIIARDLGLADKTDHTSSDGSMTPKAAVELTDEQLMAIANGNASRSGQ